MLVYVETIKKNADHLVQRNYCAAGTVPGEETLKVDKAVPLPSGW